MREIPHSHPSLGSQFGVYAALPLEECEVPMIIVDDPAVFGDQPGCWTVESLRALLPGEWKGILRIYLSFPNESLDSLDGPGLFAAARQLELPVRFVCYKALWQFNTPSKGVRFWFVESQDEVSDGYDCGSSGEPRIEITLLTREIYEYAKLPPSEPEKRRDCLFACMELLFAEVDVALDTREVLNRGVVATHTYWMPDHAVVVRNGGDRSLHPVHQVSG